MKKQTEWAEPCRRATSACPFHEHNYTFSIFASRDLSNYAIQKWFLCQLRDFQGPKRRIKEIQWNIDFRGEMHGFWKNVTLFFITPGRCVTLRPLHSIWCILTIFLIGLSKQNFDFRFFRCISVTFHENAMSFCMVRYKVVAKNVSFDEYTWNTSKNSKIKNLLRQPYKEYGKGATNPMPGA